MSQPFNTIAEALENADNGASIYIAKGSYIESLNISSLYDLEIEGGWNNNSGVWTRDENLEPTATEIIAAAPAVLLSNAPHTFIEGLFIQNGLSAENSDSLHLSRSLSIGPVAVRITGGSAILTYNEILGVSENAGSGYGVILSNAAVIIDSNFIHADTAAIVFNAGSSGLVMNNSIHLRNLSNPGYGIRLESPLRGDVHIENNVLYFEGVSMTGIYEIGDIADKVILLRNQFYGDENLIFCHEINGNITDISKLGKGNIYHNIPPYTPCFETEGLPCMTLTHIPRPPGADLDGDMLPDEWEKLYFDDTGKYSAGDDPDNDGLSNIEEYINGTDPMNRDSDQDGMNDGEEIAKERNPLMSDLIKGGGIFIKAEDILSSELSDDAVQIRWQIAETSDFSSPVLDLKTKEYLNALTVPDMVLKADTVYYARIRTYDSAGNESEWIGSLTFKMPPASNDANNNGIPDVLEIDDETSDRDHNDVADVNQTDMKCVRSFGGDIAICLKAGENTASVDSLAFADPDMISDTENRPDEMPLGLISFRITTENPGDTAEVTVYFSEPVPDNAGWYKYDTVRGWQNYSWNTRFGDDRKTAVLTLKDGGFGDADGLANGVIADPSGPAISAEIFESGVFTVGTSGIVGMDWLYDGGMYKGILGIFSLRGMDSLVSDSAAFTAESLRRILTNTEDGYVVFTDEEEGARFSGLLGESKNWNSGVYKGLKRFQMRHGDRFATVLIPNSTLSDLRGGSLSKQPLFSLATSNPDHGLHLGQIADVNGMGNAFIYEDMGITVSDKDYNDLIFQITGVTAAAPALDDLVADKANWVDWRVSEKLGKKIVEHIEMPPVREETLRLSVTLTSAVPVHLFVYNPDEDECGREGGYIAGANFEIGGNSQQIFLPVSGEGNYRVVLRGAENGTCTLSIKSLQGETVILSEEIRRVDIKAHQSLSTDVAVSFKDGGPSIEAGTPQISKGADGNPLYYDFDGNGKIDDKDIEKVKSRWHSKIGEDAYDPFYDLDNDGEISILDVTGVAYNNPRSTF
ncbi:MAG: hypothetical protein BWK80_24070 [Desulfobacteraceae bacterium IS3]|nr:MAG: hypothetical protein BWK80_24070 [Desulfobacteraceae bacterium IS3]